MCLGNDGIGRDGRWLLPFQWVARRGQTAQRAVVHRASPLLLPLAENNERYWTRPSSAYTPNFPPLCCAPLAVARVAPVPLPLFSPARRRNRQGGKIFLVFALGKTTPPTTTSQKKTLSAAATAQSIFKRSPLQHQKSSQTIEINRKKSSSLCRMCPAGY